MKTVLRVLAVLVLAAAFGWWFKAGKNPGWTKNQVEVEKYDEILDIRYKEYEPRFVPGVDFLAGSGAVALVLGGLSLVGRKKKPAVSEA